jgi:hypothetical protein
MQQPISGTSNASNHTYGNTAYQHNIITQQKKLFATRDARHGVSTNQRFLGLMGVMPVFVDSGGNK